jgi:secreted trypsin-like serine protease
LDTYDFYCYFRRRLGHINFENSEKIVGGDLAESGDAPFQVAMFKEFLAHFLLMCGGAILDPITVLTAAHCCAGQRAEKTYIGYGSLNVTKSKVTI